MDISQLVEEIARHASRYRRLQCKRCKRIWNYKGKKKYASCPSCLTSVNVSKAILKPSLSLKP